MHSSYKKRLYTNALSLSTAVLLAFLAQAKLLRTLLNQQVLLHLSKTSSSQRKPVLVRQAAQRQQILPLQQKRLLVQLGQEKALRPLQTQRVLQPK